MAIIKSEVQTPVTQLVSGLGNLASGSYTRGDNQINHGANDPLDVLIEVTVTPGTVTGNKQLVVFAKASLDGDDFTTGPQTGTALAADEPNLYYVGSLPLNTNATQQRKVFSLAAAYGGVLPRQSILVFKNDSGATFTAATVRISEVWGVAV